MWRIRGDVHELKEALFYRTNEERSKKVSQQHISVTRENPKSCLEVMCSSCAALLETLLFPAYLSHTTVPLINSEHPVGVSRRNTYNYNIFSSCT